MKECGVVFLPSFHEAIRDLPDADRLCIYDAVVRYGLYGEIIEMTPFAKSIFSLIKPVVDSSQNRYRAAKGNGGKPPKPGARPRGRPVKNQSKKQTDNQPKNQSDNQEKEKDKDSDCEKDLESDSYIERDLTIPKGMVRPSQKTKKNEDSSFTALSADEFEKSRQEKLRQLEEFTHFHSFDCLYH